MIFHGIDHEIFYAAQRKYELARREPSARYTQREAIAYRAYWVDVSTVGEKEARIIYSRAVRLARDAFKAEMAEASKAFKEGRLASGMIPYVPDERHRNVSMKDNGGVYSGSSEHWEDILFGA